MTLPTDLYLPKPEDYPKDRENYLNDLLFSIQSMYEQVAQVANGSFRNYAEVDAGAWIPTLAGTGAGSFTYTSQYGWSLRTGIMTEVWADITWSATTATGNLYLELPYIVTKSSGKPFVGVCQTSGITYTTGSNTVISAIPNTYRGEIWNYGTGVATSNQGVVASGRIIVYLRYIGVSDG